MVNVQVSTYVWPYSVYSAIFIAKEHYNYKHRESILPVVEWYHQQRSQVTEMKCTTSKVTIIEAMIRWKRNSSQSREIQGWRLIKWNFIKACFIGFHLNKGLIGEKSSSKVTQVSNQGVQHVGCSISELRPAACEPTKEGPKTDITHNNTFKRPVS